MNLNRKFELVIKFLLDECVPPILRDSKFLMRFLFKIVFKNKAHYFLDFKDNVFFLSQKEMRNIYLETSSVHIQDSNTDLDPKIINLIDSNIAGSNLLDVGCGKAVLANYLSDRYKVTACDIVINDNLKINNSEIRFLEASIEKLPFADKTFDTVICTHTLEHIVNIIDAVKELRRITKKRLIIIVPKERPYRYTFNLHVHFFPYQFSLMNYLNRIERTFEQKIMDANNVWYFQEDFKIESH